MSKDLLLKVWKKLKIQSVTIWKTGGDGSIVTIIQHYVDVKAIRQKHLLV